MKLLAFRAGQHCIFLGQLGLVLGCWGALVDSSPGIALLQGSPCLIIWFAWLTGIGNNQPGVELKYSLLPVIRVFEIDSAATLSSGMQATLAKMGREFDFSPRKVYGQQEFNKTRGSLRGWSLSAAILGLASWLGVCLVCVHCWVSLGFVLICLFFRL